MRIAQVPELPGSEQKISPTHQRLLDYFSANLGKVINGPTELSPLIHQSEWARRVRELRDEFGYQILSHRDRKGLKQGEYMLETLDRLQASRRGISKETRAFVLDRDGSTCQMCGRAAGDPDAAHAGRTVQLTMGHIVPQSQGGSDEPGNLRALCTDCNEGLQNISAVPPSRVALLASVRRATGDDQRAVLEWLLRKFGHTAT